MTENDYDIGLAFDGDADRLIICDSDGRLMDGDYILYDNDSYDLEDVSVFEKIKLDKPDYMYLYKEVKKNIERILAQ